MSRILAAVLACFLLLASTPAAGDDLLLASVSPSSLPNQSEFFNSHRASAPSPPTPAPSEAEPAIHPAIPRGDSEAFLHHVGHGLTQRTLRAFASIEDGFGLFAGGNRLRLGYRGSILDIEGGAALRLAPNLHLTGGYKALGYDQSATGSSRLDPQMRFAFFGVDLRY